MEFKTLIEYNQIITHSNKLNKFTNVHGLRIKRVVDSCKDERQLLGAELYIRNGLKAFVGDMEVEVMNEYVNAFIVPKLKEIKEFDIVDIVV